MSSMGPPKHPKKKRRLDASQEPQPGPSSGTPARLIRRQPRRMKKKSTNKEQSLLESDPMSPGFAKALEIVANSPSSSEDFEDIRTPKSSKHQSKVVNGPEPSLLGNHSTTPGFVRASKVRKAARPISTSSSSEEIIIVEDVQVLRSSKRRYPGLKQNVRKHSSRDPLSPECKRASELLRPFPACARSILSSSTSAEDGDKNARGSSSFVPKEGTESVCVSPSKANMPSGSESVSNVYNSRKWKSGVLSKKRRSTVSSSISKITKYFPASNKKESVKTRRDVKKKVTVRSTKVHNEVCDSRNKKDILESITDDEEFFEHYQDCFHLVDNSILDDTGKKEPDKTLRNAGWDKKNEDFLETITDNEQFFKNYQDRFGLVENSIEDDAGIDYFFTLPTHIIEMILCTVPIIDFMHCRLVCSRWREIIDNPQFMKYKKIYYKYKKDHINKANYLSVMYRITTPLNHLAVDGCVETLVNFMGKEYNRRPSRDMYDLLLQNPHGELADHVMKERFPQWNGKDTRVWCQLCVAVLICESVWDILALYRSLLTCWSNCLRYDVHDALYCLALFLHHFRRTEDINTGLHYRVYYALYVIENSIPFCQRGKVQRVKNIPGQQNIQRESDGGTLTYEQIRILNHRFDHNQKIKIVALAGSGKTTTLIHLARLYPQIKFLNIVFNQGVNRENMRKFPPNVICRTAHSLAYRAVGEEFKHKLCARIRAYDLTGHVTHNEERMQVYAYGKLVLATIEKFMYSGEMALSLQHVPLRDQDNWPVHQANRGRILLDASKIWRKMSEKTSDMRITHDVYLKLYQLSKPQLDGFQCIMVDEAQDCNPAILDIVLSQKVPVILVGDPHQQIYAFRGAQNALQMTQATHTYYLTKSFRFGPEISYMAACVLEVSLNVTENILVGNNTDSNLGKERSGQFAVIARSNLHLFNEAIRMIVLQRLRPHEPKNIQPHFVGGLSSYGFDQMLDIHELRFLPRNKRKLRDRSMSRFKTFQDLIAYAKYSNDIDILSKIELVNHHGPEMPKFLYALKARCAASSLDSATVVFTTAHKSKGLEFDTVSLTDDYIISPNASVFNFSLVGDQTKEEANILYVAITRAKKCLFLPEKVTKLLHVAQEKFEYPVSSKALLKDGTELTCVQCDSVFAPHTVLALVRRRTVMASGRELTEGPLCMKCRTDPTTRPDVHLNGLVMYLDPVPDNAHRLMGPLVGPLPQDPPILHDRFQEYANADRVFVINLNIH